MSVLICGMEMPTSCCNCLLAKLSPTGQTLICNYTLSTVPWDDKPFDCPLIEIPPHGRLIDADALMHDTEHFVYKTMLFGGQYVYSEDAIKNAPTIIEGDSNESD